MCDKSCITLYKNLFPLLSNILETFDTLNDISREKFKKYLEENPDIYIIPVDFKI